MIDRDAFKIRPVPWGAALAALCVLTLLGCATSGSPEAAAPAEPPAGDYVIGSGDQLSVRVWRNPELSVEVPVRPDGKISVPLLDDVQAAGLTAVELKELLTREMNEFISNPDITVVVHGTASRRAYIIGEIRSPGSVALATDLRVLDVLSMAGGFGPFADRSSIKIIRDVEGREVEYTFDYDAYVAGRAPGTNIWILPGDTIVVPD